MTTTALIAIIAETLIIALKHDKNDVYMVIGAKNTIASHCRKLKICLQLLVRKFSNFSKDMTATAIWCNSYNLIKKR